LFKALHEADTTAFDALVSKLDPPDPDKKLGPYQARILANRIISNAQLLGPLPNKLRTHVFELVHNVLSTKTRILWRNLSDTNCPLCGRADETLAHLHTTCRATTRAKEIILSSVANRSKHIILTLAQADDYVFRSDPDELKATDRKLLLLFSHCVWKCRLRFYNRPFQPEFIEASADQIARCYLLQIFLEDKQRKEKRMAEEKRKTEFLSTLNSLESNSNKSIFIFTDGSSYGNPGPAGAGYYGYSPTLPSGPFLYGSLSLGIGTNNQSELNALKAVVDHLLSNLGPHPDGWPDDITLNFFLDSSYVLNILDGKHSSSNAYLVRSVRESWDNLNSRFRTNNHVPAHVGIYPNELADYLAKAGAHGTTSTDPPPNHVLDLLKRGDVFHWDPPDTPSRALVAQPTPTRLPVTIRRSSRVPVPRRGLFDGINYSFST